MTSSQSGSKSAAQDVPFIQLRSSKTDPESELYLPRACRSVGNCAGGRASSTRTCQRGGVWKTKVRVIHDIEHFKLERRLRSFTDWKAFQQCDIHVRKPWANNRISPQIPIRSS